MKKFSVIQIVATLLLTLKAQAGTLTINGDLAVTTNLTAQSITLGGVTQTSWASSLGGGYKYVVVAEGTNDAHRGNNLRTAYTTATTLSPTSSNRVAVIVPPGSYDLGSAGLVINTAYVDLIGLVPAQMTSTHIFTNSNGGISTKIINNVHCSVRIANCIITQTVDNIRIESMILQGYYSAIAATNTVLRHVSMVSEGSPNLAGNYLDCVDSDDGFGGGAVASGTFIDCVGGDNSFAGDGGTASGTFIHCAGGGSSFGSGDGGTPSGRFIDCVGGDYSFGGFAGGAGALTGTYSDCVGGNYSFSGGGSFDSTAKLRHCQGGAGSFATFNMASDDFNYNVGGANTFLMLPQLPTTTNGLPSGTVYNSSGTLKIMP